MRLFNETREALAQQTAAPTCWNVISHSVADSAPVFEAILERCERLIDDTLGTTISLVEDDGLLHRRHFRFSEIGTQKLFSGPAEAEAAAQRMRTLPPAPAAAIRQRFAEAGDRIVVYPDVLNGPGVPQGTREFARAATGGRASYARAAAPMFKDGRFLGEIGVARGRLGDFDARERKLLEMFARQAVVALENARLFRETNEALERQTATAEILAVISESPTDVQPVFQAIAERARTLCNADVGATTRLDGDVVHLAGVRALSTQAEDAMRAAFPMAVDAAAPNIHRAIVELQPIQIADVRVEPGYPDAERAERMGFRSILSVPLLHQGRAIGTIGVARREPGRFADGAVALLQTFARQAVIAIENVRLFNETQQALERQTASAEVLQVVSSSVADTRPVFDKILDSCQRVIACSDLSLLMLDDDGLVHIGAVRGDGGLKTAENYVPLPLQRTIVGQAVQQRRVMHYPDALHGTDVPRPVQRMADVIGNYAVVVAPMLVQSRAVGAFFIVRTFAQRQWARFTEREIALVESFAGQAAIAIQNARLFRETQEALQRQTATAEVLQVISSSVADTAPVFEKIIQRCETLFQCEYANVVLLGDDGLMHLIQDTADPAKDLMRSFKDALRTQFPRPARDSIHGYALHKRQVLHYPDVSNGPGVPQGLREYASRFEGTSSSALFVPMFWEGKGIGTLAAHRTPSRPFSYAEIDLLKTFADQAVIAIQNARLFNETQEALEHQTATSEVLKVIAASVEDAQPVFDKIIASAAQLFPDALALMILQVDAQDMLHVAGIRFVGDASGPFTPEAARQREMAIAQAFPSPLAGTATELAIRSGLADIPDMQNATHVPGLQRFANIIGFNFAALFAPLMWEGQGIGSIAVLSSRLGPFGDKQRALIKTFADQAVIAIQNARLFNETKEALEQQTATAEVLQIIGSSMADPQPVFDRILVCAEDLFEADLLGIYRVRDDDLVDQAAVRGAMPEHISAMFPVPLEGSAVADALAQGHVLSYADCLNGDDVPASLRRIAQGIGKNYALAHAPMMWQGRGIGTITVARFDMRPFNEKERSLLQTFANQAVVAVQNARLFNETKEALEQQTATAEVLQVVSNSMANSQPVLDKVLDSCARLFRSYIQSVNLLGDDGAIHLAAIKLREVDDDPQYQAALESMNDVIGEAYPIKLSPRALASLQQLRSVQSWPDVLNGADVPPMVRGPAAAAGFSYAQMMAPPDLG